VTYSPVKIAGNSTGLVESREEFILPNDAYPRLENAFVWRERIKRKQGTQFLGRLQRAFTPLPMNINFIAGAVNLNSALGLNAGATIVPGSINFGFNSNFYTDPAGNGILVGNVAGSGTVNYATGAVQLVDTATLAGTVFGLNYYPNLPVMGLLSRELNSVSTESTVAFDTTYAYIYVGTVGAGNFEEFIPGFTWTGTDFNFFFPMNYWVTPAPSNNKLFWVTNFSGIAGDPIRYSAFEANPTVWINFAPTIDAAGNKLQQCLAMLPFRSRMVVFNTFEGTTLNASIQYPQRVRWAAIGNPISDTSTLFPSGANVNANAWRDDIRGQGGFLDIPTSQAIVAIGVVRDNLVIYCERSTWQLRYTGRTIAPFQIERVNPELGAQSTFSAVQFDTSLVGIGDKGIVQCDSFKSDRIDIKIPDFVFDSSEDNNNNFRIYGIRDFQQKLSYWTICYPSEDVATPPYPNIRLVYNYENDSWATFQDSFTCFGNFQNAFGLRWEDCDFSWESANFPWLGKPAIFIDIVAGNQQGFVSVIDELVVNQQSLFISNITGNSPNVTVVTSPNHNLETDQVIQITNLIATDPFFSLNNGIFGITYLTVNTFEIYTYNPISLDFDIPVINASGVYLGNGFITIRDGFSIVSKKFNYLEEGNAIQLGFVDVLMPQTTAGAITMNIYADYNDSNPVNTLPESDDPETNLADPFFNSVIPTSVTVDRGSLKNWQRVYCACRASFITIEYTLSNAQLNGEEQQSEVQIDAQILWTRKAGRLLPPGA